MSTIIKGRYIQKHDVEANWKKAINFIPLESEIIVYDPDDTYDYSRFKIGDGARKVNELPFFGNNFVDTDHTHDSITEMNAGVAQRFWTGTKSEYDAIEVKDINTLYVVTDDNADDVVTQSVVLTDTSTNVNYKLCVTNGKLNLIEC